MASTNFWLINLNGIKKTKVKRLNGLLTIWIERLYEYVTRFLFFFKAISRPCRLI
jgi:hypothetical protein